VGREGRDFVKDGFGVKVPLCRVAGWYAALGDPVEHVECFPLREEPAWRRWSSCAPTTPGWATRGWS